MAATARGMEIEHKKPLLEQKRDEPASDLSIAESEIIQSMKEHLATAEVQFDEHNYSAAEQSYANVARRAQQLKHYTLLIESFCRLGDIYINYSNNTAILITDRQYCLIKAAALFQSAMNVNYKRSGKRDEDDPLITPKLVTIEEMFLSLSGIVSIPHPIHNPYPFIAVNKSHEAQLANIRTTVRTILLEIDWQEGKDDDVEELYKVITKMMKDFIIKLWNECIATIVPTRGPIPCKYAMIAFGSMARGEMTPFSDFEWGLLVEDSKEENKQYFKFLANLLYLKVVNLGETILPAINIASLDMYDDITPRGFTFDGQMSRACKTPFGKKTMYVAARKRREQGYEELIKTPAELAALQREEWFEKDSLLPSEVYQFDLVTGSPGREMLAAEYQACMDAILDSKDDSKLSEKSRYTRVLAISSSKIVPSLRQIRALQLLKTDLNTFASNIESTSEDGKLYQAKKDLYRLFNTTLDNLGLYYALQSHEPGIKSSWKKVAKLLEGDIISPKGAQNLRCVLNIVLALRLHTYFNNREQRENLLAITLHFDPKHEASYDHKNFVKRMFIVDNLDCPFRIYQTLLSLQEQTSRFVLENGKRECLQESPFFDNTFFTQGVIWRRLMQYSRAAECFKSAIEENHDSVEAIMALGKICLIMGDGIRAGKYYTLALKLISTTTVDKFDVHRQLLFADSCVQFAHSYRELHDKWLTVDTLSGLTEVEKTRLKEASWNLILQAMQIKKAILGDRHPSYASCLTLFTVQCADASKEIVTDESGNVHLGTHDGCDTNLYLTYYNEALSIMLECFGENHPSVATIYNLKGNIHRGRGYDEFPISTRCYEKAMAILEHFYGYPYHPSCMGIKLNIGNNQLKVFDIKDAVETDVLIARETFLLVLHNLQAVFGTEQHKIIAFAYDNLADVEYRLGNSHMGDRYSKQRDKILRFADSMKDQSALSMTDIDTAMQKAERHHLLYTLKHAARHISTAARYRVLHYTGHLPEAYSGISASYQSPAAAVSGPMLPYFGMLSASSSSSASREGSDVLRLHEAAAVSAAAPRPS